MPFYLVTLPADAEAALQVNNRNTMVVAAENAAEARAVAKSSDDSGPEDKWDSGVVTLLVEGLESDFSYRVRITFTGDTEPTEFLTPAAASFILLMGAMELLLEADVRIGANVSQAAGPPAVQTIALAAGIGDLVMSSALLLNGQEIPGYSVTSAPGIAGSDRTFTFVDQSGVDLVALISALTGEKF